MRIPALLLLSIVVVNACSSRARRIVLVTLGPLSITREGLTFGLISAGRVLVAFLASVTFLFTTLADDLLESLVAAGREPSHRVRRPVGRPDGPADAGRGPARSSRPSRRAACRQRLVRASASGRSCRSSGRCCWARSSTSGSGRSRSRRAGSARDRAGPRIGSSPTRRSIAGCAWRSSLAIVGVVVLAFSGVLSR